MPELSGIMQAHFRGLAGFVQSILEQDNLQDS